MANNTCSLKDVLNVIGISQVIWIDDCFAQVDLDAELINYIKAKIVELRVSGKKLEHPLFKNLDYEVPANIFDKEIEERLNKNGDKLPIILDSIIMQLSSDNEGGLEPYRDFTPAQIKELQSLFDNLKVYSLTEWMKCKEDVFKTCNEKTLFLIDREFDREGYSPAEYGDELISSVSEHADKSFCIMFTRTVGDSDVESLRREVANGVNVPIHKFSVMSKRACGNYSSDVSPNLIKALRVVFVQLICYELASITADIMKNSLDSAVKDLASLSINAIDTAIFRNSSEEGASELDVVTRLLNLHQRMKVQSELIPRKKEIFAKLEKLRTVRDFQIGSANDPDIHRSSDLLKTWRKREIIDPPEVINLIHSPLSCGDIFKNTVNNKLYVLITQPCDLIVRGLDGHRSAMEGFFVNLYHEVLAEKYKSDRYRYFIIEGVDLIKDRSWIFDFRDVATVNLDLLDLAVYNEDGNVRWVKDQSEPSALLPGWKKRFSKQIKINSYFNGKASQISKKMLSQNEKITHCNAEIKDNKYYGISYQRFGRLRSPYSEALLGSYAAFIARTAFDHDFAKNMPEEQLIAYDDQIAALENWIGDYFI